MGIPQLLSRTLYFLGMFFISIFILCICFNPLQESDVFMYLAIARDYLTSGTWPRLDTFALGTPHAPWDTLHEWGAYFYFYFFNWLSETWGLLLAKTLLVLGIFSLIIFESNKTRVYSFFILFITTLAAYASSTRFSERSSLFGDLLGNLVLLLVLNRDQKNTAWVFLPFIFLIWVNLHPSFPLGLILILISLGADWQIRRTRPFRSRMIFLMVSIAACFCHPKGWSGFLYPFQFWSHEGLYFKTANLEWTPIWEARFSSYWELRGFLVETAGVGILLFYIVTSYLRQSRATSWKNGSSLQGSRLTFEVLAFALVTYLGVTSVRFVLFASVAQVLIAIRALYEFSEWARTDTLPPQKDVLPAGLTEGLGIASAISILVSIFQLFQGTYQSGFDVRKIGVGLDERYFPIQSLQFLDQIEHEKEPVNNPIHGNIFNTYWLGCYLAWKWNHKRPVFVHGFMTQTAFIKDKYLGLVSSAENFEKISEQYDLKAFLVGKKMSLTGLVEMLNHHPDWMLAFEDKASYVFLRRTPSL